MRPLGLEKGGNILRISDGELLLIKVSTAYPDELAVIPARSCQIPDFSLLLRTQRAFNVDRSPPKDVVLILGIRKEGIGTEVSDGLLDRP